MVYLQFDDEYKKEYGGTLVDSCSPIKRNGGNDTRKRKNERVVQGRAVENKDETKDPEKRSEETYSHSEETWTYDPAVIKFISVLSVCIALLGWISFFWSRRLPSIPTPPEAQVQAFIPGENFADIHSHIAVSLFPREVQVQERARPLLSSAVPSFTSVSMSLSMSTPSTSTSTSFSSITGPTSSLTTTLSTTCTSATSPTWSPTPSFPSANSTPTPATVLQVFQLDPPIMGPEQVVLDDGIRSVSAGDSSSDVNGNWKGSPRAGELCQVTLMEHKFKDSFGMPFIGDFAPPACMANSNTIIMNFTVQSKGGQFDRLAIIYLGDTEVFRTSTAEPTSSGIVWTYVKDMSHLMTLWRTPQKVIFDLPNQTTANITGTYRTSLTLTSFSAPYSLAPASVILPLSRRLGVNASQSSAFTIPSPQNQDSSTILSPGLIPRTANRAIVSLSATGQGDEEFWWQNVLSSASSTFSPSSNTSSPLTSFLLLGNSSFREVQLWVDGQLAGVAWPFPILFTGAIIPSFWRPMVGLQAFDLKESEIDVTPWLGLLCDGKAHTFSTRVVGLSDDAGKSAVLNDGVGSSWVVSGKLFIWTDDIASSSNATAVTTSDRFNISSPPPEIAITQTVTKTPTGENDTLTYTTSIRRSLTISSLIRTAQYPNGRMAMWTQNLSQETTNKLTTQGNIQTNTHTTRGKDVFLYGAETPYTNTYSYPLFVNSSSRAAFSTGGIRLDASVSQSYQSEISGYGISPSGLQPFANLAASSRLVETLSGTTVMQSQRGNATLILSPGSRGGVAGNGSVCFGNVEGEARFGGRSAQGPLGMERDVELWFRSVSVGNGTVMGEGERVNGKGAGGMGLGSAVGNGVAQAGFGSDVGLGAGRFLGRNLCRIGLGN